MSDAGELRFRGWRELASRVVAQVGGRPAARRLIAVLNVYDRAGGGLVAGGLAYATLFAMLPGLLLVLSVFGLLAGDAASKEHLAQSIETVLPPLSGIVRATIDQVSAGAVPTGILAVVFLLWGSSRFYSTLDKAFAQIFDDVPQRNELERTLRGVVLTVVVVGMPSAVLILSSVSTWLLDLTPNGIQVGGAARAVLQFVAPAVLAVLAVVVTGLVYLHVPVRRVSLRAVRRPAIVVGLLLAAFTQAFALVAPRLVGTAALYATFVAVFALLVWLSIGFNVLLLGAAWTRVREREVDAEA